MPQDPNGARPCQARARGARIRIGFASAFFSEGTAGRYFRSWIAGLTAPASRSTCITCGAT